MTKWRRSELSAEDPLGFCEIMRMSGDQFHEILGKIGNSYWSCNTTLLNGRLHASTFVVCWRKCLIEIKTFFQQKMLNKRHQTCMLHVLTLLIHQMFYNNV